MVPDILGISLSFGFPAQAESRWASGCVQGGSGLKQELAQPWLHQNLGTSKWHGSRQPQEKKQKHEAPIGSPEKNNSDASVSRADHSMSASSSWERLDMACRGQRTRQPMVLKTTTKPRGSGYCSQLTRMLIDVLIVAL